MVSASELDTAMARVPSETGSMTARYSESRGSKVQESVNLKYEAPVGAITPVSRDTALLPSYAQQRLWFHAQKEGASNIYHIPMAFRLQGTLNRDAWQRALNTVFSRHESLRSVFVTVDGQPQIQILPAQSGLSTLSHDLRGELDIDRRLHELSLIETSAPFDLEKGPLIRAQLIQIADDEHIFFLTQHHIVCDKWSIGILTRELSELYRAYHTGHPNPLVPLSLQYSDYAVWHGEWLNDDKLQEQNDFWRIALAGAPVSITLPTDRPRPSRPSFAGAQMPIHIDSRTP
ncbi:hypothetical protein K7432_014315 [Basidiobolus ranarum]|uniref:Condensation domain-containing protein n=1 Tax=Basidiobolus ranarum TaxID=34480 RepID=A0ABR2WHS9_9FUNG